MKRDRSQPLGVPDAGVLESGSGREGSGVVSRLARFLFTSMLERAGNPPIEIAIARGPEGLQPVNEEEALAG